MRQSEIGTFRTCPYKYKLDYIDKIKVDKSQDAQDARTVGTMFHMAIEKGIDEAIDWYYSQYYIMTDLQINEVLKLEILYPKIIELLEDIPSHSMRHEVSFAVDEWIGTVDLILDNKHIFDFKYSNNIDHYLKSPQLHLYKYFLDKLGYKIEKLGFIFIPKTQIRQKKTEDIYQFRNRILDELEHKEVKLIYVDYDIKMVDEALVTANVIKNTTNFIKTPSRLCQWCDHQLICENKEVYHEKQL